MFSSADINGLRAIVEYLPESSSCVYTLNVGVGHSSGRFNPFLPHFLEHALFCGTRKYPSYQELMDQVESRGGILNGHTEEDLTAYYAIMPGTDHLAGLDVLVQMITEPTLDRASLSAEKSILKAELAEIASDPKFLLRLGCHQLVWPGLGLTPEHFSRPEDYFRSRAQTIQAFFQEHYFAENTIVSAVGNASAEEVFAYLQKNRNAFPAGPLKSVPAPRLQPFSPERLTIHFSDSFSAGIVFEMPAAGDETFMYTLWLLDALLIRMSSARIPRALREKHLVYDLNSHFTRGRTRSAYTIEFFSNDWRSAEQIVAMIWDAIRGLQRGGFNAHEIEQARRFVAGTTQIGMDEKLHRSLWLAANWYYSGKPISLEHYLQTLSKIPDQEVNSLLGRLEQSQSGTVFVGSEFH